MRRLFGILLCCINMAVYAVDYAPFAAQNAVDNSMRSVNNASYMASGSTYTPEVYAIGANSPSAAPSGPRRAGGPGSSTGSTSDYDPNNPQWAPLGDAFVPLLLMALAFVGITYVRRKRLKAGN